MSARDMQPDADATKSEVVLAAIEKFGALSIRGVVAATGVDDRYCRMIVAQLVASGVARVVGGGKENTVYALTGKDLSAAEYSLNPEGLVRLSKLGRTIELDPPEARKLLQFLARTEDVWFPPESKP